MTNRPTLTPREQEISALAIQGKSSKEIGNALGITEPTVKGHLRRIYSIEGVRNRTALAYKKLTASKMGQVA